MQRVRSALAALAMLACLAAPVMAAAPGPSESLEPIIDRVLAVLQDKDLQGDEHLCERRSKIMEFVGERFDYAEMSKRVLGREWRKLSKEERERFVNLFSTLLEFSYIGKLENYSGQEIRFLDERIKGKRAQVNTSVEDEGKEIPVVYIMLNEPERGWMVYDIIIENVSLVRNYREQFKPILRRQKFEGLIAQVEKKVKELQEQQNKGRPCPPDQGKGKTGAVEQGGDASQPRAGGGETQ